MVDDRCGAVDAGGARLRRHAPIRPRWRVPLLRRTTNPLRGAAASLTAATTAGVLAGLRLPRPHRRDRCRRPLLPRDAAPPDAADLPPGRSACGYNPT